MSTTTTPDLQTDATLKSLDISPGTMVPPLWGTRSNFAVVLPSSVERLTVKPAATAEGATVRVMGHVLPTGEECVVPLQTGRTSIAIVVTAADGKTTRNYQLNAIRAARTPNWERLAEHTAFAARDSAGELVHDNQMWVLGGYLPELVADVWRSSDGVTWQETGKIPDASGINIPVAFTHAGKMWVTSNEGRLYSSADGAAWKLVSEKPPWAARYAAGHAVFAGKMWVMGGMQGRELKNDVWSSTDGEHWTRELEHAPWSPRQLFSNVVVHQGKLWLIGGGVTNYQPFRAYRDVWSSPDGKTWTRATDEAPWSARVWSSCVDYRNRLWLLGGYRSQPANENLRDAWHSADGANWTQLQTEEMWSARHEVSAYVFKDALWVVAGNAWPLVNDVWRLKIDGPTFTSQPVVEEYVGALYRYHATADFHADASPLKYRLLTAPPSLAIDGKTGVITGVPAALGDFAVSIEAAAMNGETARQDYTLHVISL